MTRPNFLFIMTDTQATNMVGCYSGKSLNTNNIDSGGGRYSLQFCLYLLTGVHSGPRWAVYRDLCQPVRPVDQ